MSLALSVCVLFFSLTHSGNGTQFLNITCILLLSLPAANAATVIILLTKIYVSL